ncbi:transglutaminase family protein [Hymenobacter volaticus]|uniref:Transglutaminase family protein n=1 Tax=Hymenobacter volaticus TaxID=2932254 RepID=A0ABY4GGF8_9BACT|nr:transglutaminase family protein [Hymenobacter volaticus]UOQ69926.1 transglutaminase family protein [Hymenobacter volaticus]
MPSYTLKHTTRYTYAAEVIDCANQVMLYPLADERLDVARHEVCVSNDSGSKQRIGLDTYLDCYGNTVGVFTVLQPHTVLVVESTADVTTHPILFPMDEAAGDLQWQDLQRRQFDPAFIDFLNPEEAKLETDLVATVHQLVNYADKPLKNALVLSEYVYDNVEYRQGVTNVETPVKEIWQLKTGVCQDFAHLLLALLRLAGIPARYVSGYVCPQVEGVRGYGATHAWVEAYIPFYGWLGLDPTNNCIVNDGHIRVALGRNFRDCTPVKGTYKGISTHRLEVSVQIESRTPNQPATPALAPAPTYEVPDREMPINSYRRYIDLLLQHQEQQQQ